MTNQNRAAEVMRGAYNSPHLSPMHHCEILVQALANAGLLMPDDMETQWLVQIGYRNRAGQTDIVEGIGDSKEEAVANAEEKRMLPNAVEVVRGFASRRISAWEKEAPIYASKEETNG